MNQVELHLLLLALLGLAFFVAFCISAHNFGKEIEADRRESQAFYRRMRLERYNSLTAAEQEAYGKDWI